MKTKSVRRDEADTRQDAYDQLTPTEKLARLDTRLGTGVGATRERARLQKQIEAAKAKKEKKDAKSKEA